MNPTYHYKKTIETTKDAHTTVPEGYPIASRVQSTLQKTVVPDTIPATAEQIFPYEITKFEQNGYGGWHDGPGQAFEKRLDLMPAAYTGTGIVPAAKLLKFFTITDIHISDKESPAQAIYYGYKGGLSSGYSPVMLYTTHVLDAAVQTINALHQADPFDFGISLGDTCNSTQYNELRWYVDILDGKIVDPDSGEKNDPVPGPNNDYQDEFFAAGLHKSIPWYQTLGNHDHFWMGMFPPDDEIRQALIGDTIFNMGNIFTDPLGTKSKGYYMGAIDGSTPYGAIIGAGPSGDFTDPPKVPADPNRRSLKRTEWISEFFNTTSSPVGHGFSRQNAETGFACYTFEPKAGLPIKVLVLDDTQGEDDPGVTNYGHGSLDKERYEWMVRELEKGQAENKLMIISAHIPVGIKLAQGGLGSAMKWSSSSFVTENELIATLHKYPNLILWVSGHRHMNVITALPSPDPAHPENGFWEIETSSLRDFPQQFRTIEIVIGNDGTLSIFTADVDPAVEEGSLAAIARTYAVAAEQIFHNEIDYLPTGAYNAELVLQLSPEMQKKLKK